MDEATPAVDRSDVQTVLAQATWFVRVLDRRAVGRSEPRRWRHPGLEDLLGRPASLQPDFERWLDHSDPTVAGNAAIALARLGQGVPARRLAATVRRPELKLAMRRAAVEALGELPVSQAVAELETLLAQYGGRAPAAGANDLPDMHAELLETLGRLAPTSSRSHVTAGLGSSSAVVRRAALRSWPVDEGAPLPTEVAAACGDRDPRVRASAIELVTAQRPDNTHTLLRQGLADADPMVRLTAVASLGRLADRTARQTLIQLLASRNEMMRAAAVSALAEMGAGDQLVAAVEDKSAKVRRAVAARLDCIPAPADQSVARSLVQDPDRGVAQTAITAVAQWPLEPAGPILLAGLTSASLTIRQQAAQQLASRWPPAAEIAAIDLASGEARLVDSLEGQWTSQFGPSRPDQRTVAQQSPGLGPAAAVVRSGPLASHTPPDLRRDVALHLRVLTTRGSLPDDRQRAIDALVACGPALTGALSAIVDDTLEPLPEAVYRHVLPQIDTRFESLARLESPDLEQRRKAARTLVGVTRERPLSELALRRLERLVIPEPDASIWWNVELALAGDPRAAVVRIHLAGLSHPGLEVRRRACEYLAHRPDPRFGPALLATLDDPSPVVVRAAVVALGQIGACDSTTPETDRDRQREALERLLVRRDASLRLAVAETLTKCGYPSGPAALERLAYDGDPRIRRQVAEAMGRLNRRSFVAPLIRLLDDRHDVRRIALMSLREIAPQESGALSDENTTTVDEQISRWKRWYADRPNGS